MPTGLRTRGIAGQPPPPDRPGTYLNEQFVDALGHYVGDGSDGYANWVHATALPVYGFAGSGGTGFGALFSTYWGNPQGGTRANIYDYPTEDVQSVTDNSGPPAFPTDPALEIEGAGFHGNASWTRNNWTPAHASQWIYEGWFRCLDCAGFTVGLGYALAGHPVVIQGTFTITEGWQFFRCKFPWIYASAAVGVPVIALLDSRFENDETRTVTVPPFGGHFTMTKYAARYFILAKRLHLYTQFVTKGIHAAQRI